MLTSADWRIPKVRRLAVRASATLAATLATGAIVLPAEPPGALAASTPTCATSGLVIWLNQEGGGGALGSIYYKLELTNLSGHACTLYGFPGVAAVNLAGRQLGLAATRETTPKNVRIVDVGALPGCRPVAAAGLRVYPPGQTRSKVIPFPFETCSRGGRSSLLVQAVSASE